MPVSDRQGGEVPCRDCRPKDLPVDGCEVKSDRIKRHIEKRKKERIDPGSPDLHPLRNPLCRRRVEELYEEVKSYAGAIMIFCPTGALKAAIAEEKAMCIEAACDAVNGEDKEYALKVNYVIPFLLLQRPSKKMKNEKLRSTLLRDITLWRKGELNDIASRAILCAKHTRESKRRSPQGVRMRRFFPLSGLSLLRWYNGRWDRVG